MTRAWEIAREGVAKFGGKVKEYFAQALVMAWAEIKKGVKKVKTHFEAYKEVKTFSKQHFAEYVNDMKSKGVKVSNVTSDSADMVAPNGLVVRAYAIVPDATVDGGVVKFHSIINVALPNGKTQRGSIKTFKYNKNDYSVIN